MRGRTDYLKVEELIIGKAYELDARNISVGIWDGTDFHGIREKFTDKFMCKETHYDLDTHYGTAQPLKELS